MSEVKRYWVPHGTLTDQSGWHQDDNEVVQACHFDRVTAERDGLQLSLTTADQTIDDLQSAIARRNQRIEELVTALTRIHGRCEAFADDERDMRVTSVEVVRDIAARALAGTAVTFAGLPVVVDPSLPPDEVRLVQPNTPQ